MRTERCGEDVACIDFQGQGMIFLLGIRGPGVYHHLPFIDTYFCPSLFCTLLCEESVEARGNAISKGNADSRHLFKFTLPRPIFFPQISLAPPLPQICVSTRQCLFLQLTLNKRYDASQQALDLRNLRFDPGTCHRKIMSRWG